MGIRDPKDPATWRQLESGDYDVNVYDIVGNRYGYCDCTDEMLPGFDGKYPDCAECDYGDGDDPCESCAAFHEKWFSGAIVYFRRFCDEYTVVPHSNLRVVPDDCNTLGWKRYRARSANGAVWYGAGIDVEDCGLRTDLRPKAHEHAAYVLRESNGRSLYVGRSRNPLQRAGGHTHGHVRFESVAFYPVPEEHAGELERALIKLLGPPKNEQIPSKTLLTVEDEELINRFCIDTY